MYLMMYMDTDTIHLTKFHVKVYQGVYLNWYDTLEYWKLKRKCIQVYINYFSPQRYINLNSVNSEKKCTQLYIDKSAYTLHLESPTNIKVYLGGSTPHPSLCTKRLSWRYTKVTPWIFPKLPKNWSEGILSIPITF